ncbi:hypothetical protein THAOC_24021, partial [Thalassiosira oceanica]
MGDGRDEPALCRVLLLTRLPLATRWSQEPKGPKRGNVNSRGDLQSSRRIALSYFSSKSRQLGRVSARTMRGIRGDDLARGTEAGPRAGTHRRIFPEVGASAWNGGRRSNEHVAVSARTRIRTTKTSGRTLSQASGYGCDNQLFEMWDEGGPCTAEESRTTNCAAAMTSTLV